MKKSANIKKVTDFVLTISDSEDEVPDYDEDSDLETKEGDSAKPDTVNKTKKTKKSKKSARKEEDADKELLNPNFVFSLDTADSIGTEFTGWDFDVEEKSEKKEDDVKKTVDLDTIIRRKGGLSDIADVNSEEEIESAGEADSDDEELALDGFGMGSAAVPTVDEESQDNSDSSSEEEDESEDEEEGEIMHGSGGEEEEVKEDTAEDMAEFYAPDGDSTSVSTVHTDFQSLNLSRPLLKGLSALGYTKPSPIQSASIPIALLGKDIVAGAVTGSGKTAAYMIPIIERLLYKPAKIASTRVVVLVPTRELAIQVGDVGKKIGQFVNGLTFGLAVGGLNLRQQEQELKQRPDIVIATPGRFIDHIRNSASFNVDSLEILVVDEADRMLEEGFQKELTEILSLIPSKRQTLLFSATMNSNIKSLIQLSLQRPVRIMIDPPKQAATGLLQEFVRIRKREASKPALLFNTLANLDLKQQIRVIVFVARKETAHRLRIVLGLLGLKVSELHGSLTQEQRLQSITDFKRLTVPVLICTDLAARGLDIPKIEVVINFDMPKTYEIYLHRVGRTARAGRAGKSITFVGESSQDRSIVKDAIRGIENQEGKAVGRNVDWIKVEEVNKLITTKQEVIEEVLEEEKQEKEMLQAEMELRKGENLLKYESEIASRPKRTWFQTEKEKKDDKLLPAKRKVLNSKKRKALGEREDGGKSYKKTKTDRVMDQKRSYAKQKVRLDKKKKKKGKK
ncbi:unnamed protein product [Kuraishia capsulata CBS 1993]|uniref:ATP-dependent RNA helicase DRS1 n=1 Tax=Kuraishia capsulata CBS 1993 TaxID=1382522 RepID=W6MHZ6_9ASCO|nr:uncharacterized protein KUCA_T00001656001 [Kuraishia capsulata CBS 1993]CDK25686.1 unnamed protein product [Kuraishia capsulata CBS 1993]